MSRLDDFERFLSYDVSASSRTIWLGDDSSDDSEELNYKVAGKVAKALHYLEAINLNPITILIHSQGGVVEDGMSIYDAIVTSKCFITAKVIGSAYSMASVVLQAADHRIMTPNSKLMIHYGSSNIGDTHNKTLYKTAEEIKKLDRKTESIYYQQIIKKRKDFTKQELRSMLEHDTYLSATQCLQLGLIDEIYNPQGAE